MRAIVLLGHGSRVPGAAREMDGLAGKLRELTGVSLVKVCFLSRLGPHLPETIKACVTEGAEEIMVIPYFLHAGLHILVDIPEELQKLAVEYPQTRIVFGKHLGFDVVMAEILARRVDESLSLPDVREIEVPDRANYPVPPGQGEFVEVIPDK
ncbi:MAG: CbiX/SirB N-terminal domain-containing protein [Eubacteriales bacterium]|jgi:sirohydrochlorin ferrochelatase|nr:CbiX/SirB N-terminal domain-containing protein [Pseudomonadota bacterium]MBU4532571.1 CbiX/SirB N-terminal domain-containing protein [Bacillota bacterium]MBV1728516.1 CbiX/SirB N-terminal domain-containing protein [Desulforudis sp.]MDP3051579.1 CbiX/SirB N-terminal domain-containing protein [Eubacteriales bacterium]MDQ7789360.1 CbiX/SirB N-terminal domain-containing protein [Clostridia bacterium]